MVIDVGDKFKVVENVRREECESGGCVDEIVDKTSVLDEDWESKVFFEIKRKTHRGEVIRSWDRVGELAVERELAEGTLDPVEGEAEDYIRHEEYLS